MPNIKIITISLCTIVLLSACSLRKENISAEQPTDTETTTGAIADTQPADIETNKDEKTDNDQAVDTGVTKIEEKINNMIEKRNETITDSDELTEDDIDLINNIMDELVQEVKDS